MDPTPHTSHSSSTAAATSSAGSPRGSMSTVLLASPAAHSQSQRRSSLYPPLLNRIASRISAASADYNFGSSSSSRLPQALPPSLAAGGSRRRSRTETLYEELYTIRSTSAEFCARLDAIAESRRNNSSPLLGGQQLHRQAWPSSPATSSGLQQMPGGSFSRYGPFSSQQQTRPSMTTARLPPLPRGGFSGYTSSSSATSGLPDLPGGNVSGYAALLGLQRARSSPAAPGRLDLLNGNISAGYARGFSLDATSGQTDLPGGMSFSSYASPLSQQQRQHAWPSSTLSRLPDLPGGTSFGYTPSLSAQAGSSSTLSGLPPVPGSLSAFAQSPPPVASDHQQQPLNSGKTTTVDPPPSWGSTTSRTGFVQRPSSPEQYELPPLPPNLQMPLLPVRQEPGGDSSDDRLEPGLIYMDNETTDDLGLGALMASFESSPGLESRLPLLESSSSGDMQRQLGGNTYGGELISSCGAIGSSGHSLSPIPEGVVSAFGSSAAVGGMMASNCESSMPMSQQQVPWHDGTFASCSSHLSPHWQPSPKSDTSGFVQPTSAFVELPPLPPSLDMGILPAVGNSTWNASSTGSSDQNWGAMQRTASNCGAIGGSSNCGLGIMTGQYHSSSMESSIVAMPKLRLGGSESKKMAPLPSPSSHVDNARSSMSRSGANANLLTDIELEIIMKNKHLQDLLNYNPKRVKR